MTPVRVLGALLAAALGAALWWRRHPSACPYEQRFWVQAPHPVVTRTRLREVLGPVAGERVLEVGPGTGYYALSLAEWVGPDGRLDLLDLQREMLDHVLQRARRKRLDGRIVATQGDATALPYPDGTFDAALIAIALGEIPDQDAALRELRPVLKPGGRLVVGELMLDPHLVTARALERRAAGAGLRVEERSGTWLGYFARLRPSQPTRTAGPAAAPASTR